jgi:hypothetical protein
LDTQSASSNTQEAGWLDSVNSARTMTNSDWAA